MRLKDKPSFSNGQRDYARFQWFFCENDKNTLNANVPEKLTFLGRIVYPSSTCISYMRKDSKSEGAYLLNWENSHRSLCLNNINMVKRLYQKDKRQLFRHQTFIIYCFEKSFRKKWPTCITISKLLFFLIKKLFN